MSMETFDNESTYKKFLEKGKEKEFDKYFDNAVNKVKKTILGKEFPIYINGKEQFSADRISEFSPIDGTLVGTFQKAHPEHVEAAIDAAEKAFGDWRFTDYESRSKMFIKAADLFSKNKFLLSAILSIENGKTRYESVGEVDEAIDFLRYYSRELMRNKGYSVHNKIQSKSSWKSAGFQGAPGNSEIIKLSLKPYGVFGIIAPFNFPVSISTGMSAGAMITGNTVVFKPSSTDNMTMLTGLYIYKMFSEAGIPRGVFNYITGPGSEVGEKLVSSPKVSGIAFTGSRSTGMSMMRRSLEMGQNKIFVVEMGGKNPVIVSKSADIDTAVNGVMSSAFGFAGQKCSAASRLYVHESISNEVIDRLVGRVKSLKIGNPLVKENYVGPLISEKALDKFRYAVDEASKNGQILVGGAVLDDSAHSIYVEPTIAKLPHSNKLFREELFVPFLLIYTFSDFKDTIKKANDVAYGLTAGLYSKDKTEVEFFSDNVESGVLYINRGIGATTGAIVGRHSFVGWKGSGLTGKGTGSRFYLQQFMHEQSISYTK